MLRYLCLIAALLPSTAPAQPFLPGKHPAAATAPQLSPQQQLTQYRHDQINLLALRADPPSLLAAALLARSDANDKSRPDVLKTPALLKRAQRFGEDSVLVWWTTAVLECSDKQGPCPAPATLQKLEQLDAQNAAVWALSLWRADQDGDEVTARAALTSAAQAKRYRDYFGSLILAIYHGEGVLPMRSQLLQATGQNASVDGYRLITAAGIAAGLIAPETAAIQAICKAVDGEDTSRIQDCLSLAKSMAASGSMSTEQAGIALLESLTPPDAQRDGVRLLARRHAWRRAQINRLGDRLATDTRVTRLYLQALQAGGAETDAVDAVLRGQRVALKPPSGWQPAP